MVEDESYHWPSESTKRYDNIHYYRSTNSRYVYVHQSPDEANDIGLGRHHLDWIASEGFLDPVDGFRLGKLLDGCARCIRSATFFGQGVMEMRIIVGMKMLFLVLRSAVVTATSLVRLLTLPSSIPVWPPKKPTVPELALAI